ncbi:hypothetical protein V1318_04310 [Lysobacter sp. CCNWLW3]|uniref:hypothetical protein n=1 Tax=unclassified Lysobacter TaxID=2635362 RepID=UPI002FD5B4C3
MNIGSSIEWGNYISASAWWTRQTAPMTLALLLERLKEKQGSLSYSELAMLMYERYGEPVQSNKQKYGRPLGAAADAAIIGGRKHGIKVPPISLIVVNANTGYAGDGANQFVPRLRGTDLHTRDPKRLAIIDREVERIWALETSFWERLEQLLGISAVPAPKVRVTQIGPPTKPLIGGEGEGQAHEALKHWVISNPQRFSDFGHFNHGQCEAPLQSGDSIDAMLCGPTSRLAVEVKASNSSEAELIRGIFQCVKYRATLQAEARAYPKHRLPGTSILVSTVPLSRKAAAIAEALGVRFMQVAKSCERRT